MPNLSGGKDSARYASLEGTARTLAIDYGQKRIGVAVSDEMGLTAQPLAVIVRKNRQADMNRIKAICAQYSVARVIVGHPVHITGDLSPMAEEAARFAERLRKSLRLEIELIDERLTSWEARQTLSATKNRSAAKRTPIDDVAAAVLLRDYLEHVRAGSPAGSAGRS